MGMTPATVLLSAAISRFPLLLATVLVAGAEAFSAAATYLYPSTLPIEWADINSIVVALALSLLYYTYSAQTPRQQVLLCCVALWGTRLAAFLSGRIRRGFHDSRLDRFRGTVAGAKRWCFAQTLWVSVTLLPVWVGMSRRSAAQTALNAFDAFAVAAFAVGLGVETLADVQKAAFLEVNKSLPAERRKPACDVGLFRYSRFPNYFGEWLVWTAITLLAWQAVTDWSRVFLPLCPWFVLKIFYWLSIPIAVRRMRKRSSDEQFKAWSAISLFVPMPPAKQQSEVSTAGNRPE